MEGRIFYLQNVEVTDLKIKTGNVYDGGEEVSGQRSFVEPMLLISSIINNTTGASGQP